MKIEISSKVYLVLILIFSSLIVWPLFLPGYFFHHDDLQVMRVFEMRKCFEDLQIPCRWVPDMGYGNGFPLFNYYSALPYYIGAALSYAMGLINASKALFFIPLVLGGVSIFFLGQKLFGKNAGFLTAILYMFAPYRALDSYVRGAVAESFALALVPLVFYFVLRIAEKPSKSNITLSSLSLAAFLISHNIMTMFFMPFLIIWGIMVLKFRKWESWKPLILSLVLGIGLSSFFLLPVFFEKDLVHTETLIQGGSDFRTHFVGISQLFLDRGWGYGGSEFGPNDTISFQIGWPLWWFVIGAVFVIFLKLKKEKKISAIALFFLVMFLISIFMSHNQSAFIWEMIGPLQYAQFPWRFLSLSIFSAAILAGFCVNYLNIKIQSLFVWIFVLAAIFLNWAFFIPRDFYTWINDTNKLEDPLWEIQQKAGIMDYLPKTAHEPFGRAPDNIEIISGSAQGSNYVVRSNKFSFDVNVMDSSYIQVPVFDFPNWKVYVNGKFVEHDNKSGLGRIGFNLGPGNYKVEGVFTDTYLRIIANSISLVSVFLVILIWLNKRVAKKLT